MRLFQSGARKVSVRARIGDERLEVVEAEKR
jgi:hypothetical protein